jgi:phytoene dehydrogenase-like protein
MVDWAKNKDQSSHFMDMARHILQLRHDPWPCHFVADYILRHVGVTFLDSDPITHLIQEHGEVGLAVLKFHGISHLFARKEAEDKHAKEKLQLQVRINRLDRKIATLNERLTALQDENPHLRNRLTRRPERNGHRRHKGGLNALQGSLDALQER